MLDPVFSSTALAAINAGSGAVGVMRTDGMAGYHVLNQSGAVLTVTDELGKVVDYIPPWFDVTGTIMQASRTLKFTVSTATPILQVASFAPSQWQVLAQFYMDPLPLQRTQLAVPLSGSGYAITGTITGGTIGISGGTVDTTHSVLGTADMVFVTNTANQIRSIGLTADIVSVLLAPVSGSANVTACSIVGATTGITYYRMAGALPTTPIPINAFGSLDNVLTVTVSTNSGGGAELRLIGSQVFLSSGVGNNGQSPLIVSPASGAQTLVVPGSSATASLLSSLGPTYTIVELTGNVTLPTSIFGFAHSARLTNSTGAWLYGDYLVGLRGKPSNKLIWLHAGSLATPPPSVGTSSDYNYETTVYPFPLSTASLLSPDTQFVHALGYFNNQPTVSILVLGG